ncbi:MAG: nucleoside deaminase [Schwartzia sp.]|nr:nucleoside deaminase [Schwartzia sp. (in: firmicutes)]
MSLKSFKSYNAALRFMNIALEEARLAGEAQEVPVGAVIVDREGNVLARGRNSTVSERNIHGHAEINAINELFRKYGRVPDDLSLFVTLRPCAMCMGAIISSGIKTVFYGAERDESASDYFPLDLLPESVETFGGILCEESKELLNRFFKGIREDR